VVRTVEPDSSIVLQQQCPDEIRLGLNRHLKRLGILEIRPLPHPLQARPRRLLRLIELSYFDILRVRRRRGGVAFEEGSVGSFAFVPPAETVAVLERLSGEPGVGNDAVRRVPPASGPEDVGLNGRASIRSLCEEGKKRDAR
jgi:hypothetical protein